MNRIQFWVLTGLSSLAALLLIAHILLSYLDGSAQTKLAGAQQAVQQGEAFKNNLRQLAMRIYQDSQKTQDQGLKDLLVRQQISATPQPQAQAPAASPDNSSAPATH